MCIICNTKAVAQIFGTLLGSEKVSNCQQDWVEPGLHARVPCTNGCDANEMGSQMSVDP